MRKWLVFLTVVGTVGSLFFGWMQAQPQLCGFGFPWPVCLNAQAREQNADSGGGAEAETPRTAPDAFEPYSLTGLSSDVRSAVLAARDAQRSGLEGARQAREAAARGDDVANRARSGQSGFVVVHGSAGVWQGEPLAVNAIVYGVKIEGGNTVRGEFQTIGTNAGVQIIARLHVRTAPEGRFEGRAVESNEQWSGPGRFVFANGDRYEGMWRPRSTVAGVLTFADGGRHEGMFEDIQRPGFDLVQNGPGVLWSADGRVIHAGIWSHGAYVEQ